MMKVSPCPHTLTPAALAAALLVLPLHDVVAHGGGLNAEGCHNNHKTGEYHCHN